ncbi:hypothetical protein HFP67_23655 [Bacillus sp. CB102A.1]
MGSKDIPRGLSITNWYQNNCIILGDVCTEIGKVPCSSSSAGLSCGYSDVPGAVNIKEEFMKDYDGNRERETCPFGHKHILTSHTEMDDNQWIRRQICEKIYDDIRKLIATSEEFQLISILLTKL